MLYLGRQNRAILSADKIGRFCRSSDIPFLVNSAFEMATGGRKDAELDRFLRNVDEVDSIIKGLALNESSATEKADEFLQRYQQNTQSSNAVVDR